MAYDDTTPHQRPEVREYRESKKEARKEERKRKWKNFKIKGGNK